MRPSITYTFILLFFVSGVCLKIQLVHAVHHLTGTPFQTAYLINTPDTDRITVHLIIQNGEVDNSSAEGLLHYTEHLAWLSAIGSEDRSADRDANAWTNKRAVGYWLTGAKDNLPEVLASLTGIFNPIDLPQSFMIEERSIIEHEYDLRFTNNFGITSRWLSWLERQCQHHVTPT